MVHHNSPEYGLTIPKVTSITVSVHPDWVHHSSVTGAHFGLTACSALWLITYCSIGLMLCLTVTIDLSVSNNHQIKPVFYQISSILVVLIWVRVILLNLVLLNFMLYLNLTLTCKAVCCAIFNKLHHPIFLSCELTQGGAPCDEAGH